MSEEIVARKGEKVILHCCTHDLQSEASEEYICEDDTTDKELTDMAEEFMWNTKEPEWYWTKP